MIDTSRAVARRLRGEPGRWRGVVAVLVLGGSLATACTATREPVPTTVPTTGLDTPVETTAALASGPLSDFVQQIVSLDGAPLLVAIAATPAERARGLMGVTDLGNLAGMLFVFDEEVSASFWMKDTLIPLDIAFFEGDGRFLRSLTMIPCDAEPCATYGPDAPFRFALEMPAGTMPDLGPGSLLVTGS